MTRSFSSYLAYSSMSASRAAPGSMPGRCDSAHASSSVGSSVLCGGGGAPAAVAVAASMV